METTNQLEKDRRAGLKLPNRFYIETTAGNVYRKPVTWLDSVEQKVYRRRMDEHAGKLRKGRGDA